VCRLNAFVKAGRRVIGFWLFVKRKANIEEAASF
jgi:hypothetical protein